MYFRSTAPIALVEAGAVRKKKKASCYTQYELSLYLRSKPNEGQIEKNLNIFNLLLFQIHSSLLDFVL